MTTKCCCCVCTTFVLVVVTSVTLFLVWYFYWKDCVDEEELTKCSNATECDIIETKLGNIKGILLPLFFVNDTFCAYRGIRYAKSPTDNLRFKPPEASGNWTGDYNATSYGKSCISSAKGPNSNEDCLFLNVFTPSENQCNCRTGKKPVLVYIHGTTFNDGSINGPELLMERCIILVTINYRVGGLGFLSLSTPEYSGNMGLKDQQLAIEWIHENIDAFNGDPDRITLFGEDDGGASIIHQMLNSTSRNNFKQIFPIVSTSIVQNVLAQRHNYTGELIHFLAQLDQKIGKESDLINYLKQVSPEFIEFASHHFAWKPVVENSNAESPFLTEDPMTIFKNESFDIPTMLSFSDQDLQSFDAFGFYDAKMIESLNKSFNLSLPFVGVNRVACATELKPIFEKIREFYFGKKKISFDSIEQYKRMMLDMNIGYFNQRLANIQTEKTDVWLLKLATRSMPISFNGFYTTRRVPPICYLLYCQQFNSMYEEIKRNETVEQLNVETLNTIKFMTKILSTFATNGVPSSKINGNFPEYEETNDLDDMKYVELSNTGIPSIGYKLNEDAFKMWRSIEEDIDKIKTMKCNED